MSWCLALLAVSPGFAVTTVACFKPDCIVTVTCVDPTNVSIACQ